jgi:hypothetical protein
MTLPTAVDIETISHRVKMEYIHRYGLRELRKVVCACILSGSRRCMGRKVVRGSCYPPGHDHLAAFKAVATGEFVLVSQPYAGPDIAKLTAQSEAFAAEWGFAVRISRAESWHYPGKTILVEYRKVVAHD